MTELSKIEVLNQQIADLTNQIVEVSCAKDMAYEKFTSKGDVEQWKEFETLKEKLQGILNELSGVKAQKCAMVPSYWVEYEHKVPYVVSGQIFSQIARESIFSNIDIQIDTTIKPIDYGIEDQMNLWKDLTFKLYDLRDGEIEIRNIKRVL